MAKYKFLKMLCTTLRAVCISSISVYVVLCIMGMLALSVEMFNGFSLVTGSLKAIANIILGRRFMWCLKHVSGFQAKLCRC